MMTGTCHKSCYVQLAMASRSEKHRLGRVMDLIRRLVTPGDAR